MDTSAVGVAKSESFRFSLRSLLLGTALLSIPLTLLHWLGGLYLFALVLSTCLVVICVFSYQPPLSKTLLLPAGLAFPVSIGITFVYIMATANFGGTGPFVFHTLLNFGVCLACVLVRCSRLPLTIALCATAIVPYAMKISEIQEVRGSFEQMLADYPLESLEARLAFETNGVDPTEMLPGEATKVSLSANVDSNLTEQEGRYESSRSWALAALHDNYTAQFEAAVGFGYMRMRRLSPERLEPTPIDFAVLPLPIKAGFFEAGEAEESTALHRAVAYDFLSRDRIGYVRDLQHVAGFQSHSSTALGESIDRSSCCSEDEEAAPRWQLARLELVSLLRHPTPRVYVSDSLPEMDKLDDFEHRALSAFESGTLANLQAEEDVVVELGDQRIRMVGALRASKDCLECHQGKRGKLLGALSYELARVDVPLVGK